jgi:hypothetical protein
MRGLTAEEENALIDGLSTVCDGCAPDDAYKDDDVVDRCVARGLLVFKEGLPCMYCGEPDEGSYYPTPLGLLALRLHSIVKSLSAA